ncbi:MAG: CCA tRNA nucleotidyltransferase [bacterium]
MENDFPNANFTWVTDPRVQKTLAALTQAGGQARFVGGCVRDSLLGGAPFSQEAPTDIDVATTLLPKASGQALEKSGIKAIPTGAAHGTITAICDDLPIEITTLRADIDTDGRHATVQFTTHWDEDWRRRDFTINAIYYSADTGIFDPAGGMADLAARRVRFIGEAETRLQEDYLRIMRFYRFSARFAREYDLQGRQACQAQRAGLAHISAERIGSELLKILSIPTIFTTIDIMQEDGVLAQIWPEAAAIALFEHIEKVTPATDPARAIIKLAALWPDARATKLDHQLRLSGAMGKRRRKILSLSDIIETPQTEYNLRVLCYRHGAEPVAAALRLAQARHGATDKTADDQWHRNWQYCQMWSKPEMPFTAKDFMQRGLTSGPALGHALKAAEDQWVHADFPTDPTKIDQIIQSCCDAGRVG